MDENEPTALDLILESVERIVMAYNRESNTPHEYSAKEWHDMHHDLWASYSTYLYSQWQEESTS